MSARKVMQKALEALRDCWRDHYQHTSPRRGQWVLDAIAGLEAELAKPCDMCELCIGCEPRNADGSCPDAAPPADVSSPVDEDVSS